ncbi:MAG TPA: hypothetical protein VJT68_08660 [Thermoleophilaceae bacterium]|nr:hypothetical protein [Thermoleophilaceae bacterium]
MAAAAVLLALSGLLAGPASALPPGRSGMYGGGAVSGYMQFVSLRVTPGGTFTSHATLVTRCSPRFGDELTESITVRNAPLTAAGRYSATSSFTDDVDPGVPLTGGMHAEGTISFSARVLAGGLARGTVRVRTKYSRSRGGAVVSSCDTGSIAWTARRPPADAGTGLHRLQPGTHRGATGQDEPFLMRVVDRGRMVRRAGLTVRVDCGSAIGLPLDVVAQRVRVRRGRFAAGGDFDRPYTGPDGRRVVEHYAWELRGRFGRRGARGTFEMTGVVRRRSDGRRVGSCATGTIDWRAAR